jgi:hypothetical protein
MSFERATALVLRDRWEGVMLENQLIGIAGVFVLTFCLIALYHLIGAFGTAHKRYALRNHLRARLKQNLNK